MKPGRVAHWLADAGRLIFAFGYWNLRKTLYRLRGRQGTCPCQNASDDNIPGKIRCDAVAWWHEPARFRAVCPLLVKTPAGWRCSVAAGQVRPFWARALVSFSGCVAIGYLAVTLAILVVLRTTGGAPVTWGQLLWPANWRQIPAVQARHLLGQAMQSFARGDLDQAYLALTTARQRDPGNYEINLLLAQITLFQRSDLLGDELFMRLWKEQPAKRLSTAVVYHDTLLSLGRFAKLAEFSVVMAKADSAHASLWVKSALLGVENFERAEADQFKTHQADAVRALAPSAQVLLTAALDYQRGEEVAALAVLHRPLPGPLNFSYVEYQLERLAAWQATGEAQRLLDELGVLLGKFEQLRAQVMIDLASGGWEKARPRFSALLKLPGNARRAERLATVLIQHPDGMAGREFLWRVREDAALAAEADAATLWVTALVCGLPGEADYWRTHGKPAQRAAFPPNAGIDFASRDPLDQHGVVALVQSVVFPREVVLALISKTQAKKAVRRSR